MTSLLLPLALSCIFLAVLVTIGATGLFGSQSTGVARSLAALDALHTTPVSLREQELQTPFVDRVLGPAIGWFVAVGRRFTPDDRIHRLRRRLDLAGNPPGWDVDRILGMKALASIVGFILGIVVPPILGRAPLVTLGVVLVSTLAGWFAPSLWLYQVAYDRSQAIRRDLPDSLDLMTISVESGLAFDAALAQVARKTTGPLASEFFRVLQEMQIGTGRIDAMRALSERTDVTELKSFIGAMIQADAFGIAVASVLRVQAKEMRIKRSQRAEELAQKVPVKILFPLIFCILPCLFIVILGPAVIQMIQNFSNRGF